MRVRAPTWDDVPEVIALVQAADVAVLGETHETREALESDWREVDLANDAWVIEVDGRIGAYALFEDRGGGRLIVEGHVHPELRGRGLGSRLIDVTERHARASVARQPPGVRVYLQNAALVGDECTPKLFARRRYEPAQYQFRMLAELDEPPVDPTVPGVDIRLMRDPDDRRPVHAVLEDAFAFGRDAFRRREYDEWAAEVFGREHFDPTLTWVASEGDAIVGASVCGWKEAGDWGWVGTLGVLPSHRGRGIGAALLHTAFAEFWRRGERRVALGVAADNPSATGLYERAGMRVLYTIVLYEKELRAAA
ncbi:MAG: GNAT family N-acetyltransferase [Actinomycetota bacterium]|nr:GNAT family N-acetyltransferase [Actinomycetota bacterium]